MTESSDKQTAYAQYISLSAFERDIITTIHTIQADTDTQPYGLAIKKALHENGYEAVNHGRLYPVLDELANQAIIEKQPHPSDGRTNLYTLTGHGRGLLQAYYARLREHLDTDDRLVADGGDPAPTSAHDACGHGRAKIMCDVCAGGHDA